MSWAFDFLRNYLFINDLKTTIVNHSAEPIRLHLAESIGKDWAEFPIRLEPYELPYNNIKTIVKQNIVCVRAHACAQLVSLHLSQVTFPKAATAILKISMALEYLISCKSSKRKCTGQPPQPF